MSGPASGEGGDGTVESERETAVSHAGDGADENTVDVPALSVVVVTRNEADRVDACLSSVFEACRAVDSFEVILVDSNSTDGTIERARDYPITVLRIPTDELSTPAAGRYVGTRHASAAEVLFVDGDMALAPAWLPAAIRTLRSRADVAAVDGRLAETETADTQVPQEEAAASEVDDTQGTDVPATDATPRSVDVADDDLEAVDAEPVDAVRGVALYDAEALETVGGFDPHLRSLEDIHLGFELREAGYRLYRLQQVAATHPASQQVTEPLRRWRLGYAVGIGQALRLSVRSPAILRRHLSRMRYRVVASIWLFVGALATRNRTWLRAWLVASTLGFVVLSRKLGPLEALTFCLDKLLGTVGVAVGVWIPPADPSSFPLARIEVVERGPVHTSLRSEGNESPGLAMER